MNIDMDICKHDMHRNLRNNFSETILCEGKRPEHIIAIVDQLLKKKINVFGTRVSNEVGTKILDQFNIKCIKKEYDPISRTFTFIQKPIKKNKGKLAIVCAGTADISVAEEANKTAYFFGTTTNKFYDVGVAGIHRVLDSIKELRKVDCIIAVAGMEGALPSVIGGLVPAPIIAVPTSVGYGANLKGFAALLAMLNTCSEGIVVVNIDNGFGAACSALRIIKRIYKVS